MLEGERKDNERLPIESDHNDELDNQTSDVKNPVYAPEAPVPVAETVEGRGKRIRKEPSMLECQKMG